MKKGFHIYIDISDKESYKEICAKIGVYPSLRIQRFIEIDIEYLRSITREPLSVPLDGIRHFPSQGCRQNAPFDITIEELLRDEYKQFCEKAGTSASIRIGSFVSEDTKRLITLLPNLKPEFKKRKNGVD